MEISRNKSNNEFYITSSSLNSITATLGLRLTVTDLGTGNCSTSPLDLPSLALFFLIMSFVGSGCIIDMNIIKRTYMK